MTGRAAALLAAGLLAGCAPPLHDVTTDPLDPPAFVTLLRVRGDAPNPPGYDGPEAAAMQAGAYPEVRPLVLPACPPPRAFDAAAALARARGWKIVAVDWRAMRLEASDTTPVFRFVDDVVVRVRPEGAGARVDMRSKSRMGTSDLGTNARRVTGFLRELAGAACR